MKRILLVMSLIFLAIACVGFWTIGSLGIGGMMTCVFALVGLLIVYLLKDYKNARWFVIIFLFILSLLFCIKGIGEIKLKVTKLNDKEMSSGYELVGPVMNDKVCEDEEQEENFEEENNNDEDEKNENTSSDVAVKNVPQVNTVTQIIEKRVEVPVEKTVEVEKKVVEYVEVPVVEYIEVPLESNGALNEYKPDDKADDNEPETETSNQETYTANPTIPNNYYEIYTGDPTSSNGGQGMYTGDPTGGYYGSSSSIKISGPKTVTQGKSYTYTITGVSSVSESKLKLPANVTAKKVGNNKFKLYFEEDYTGNYHIGYGSASISVKVCA